MSYEPLHHKYRPQTFADLVGQDAIATTLTNAIVSQRIAPAYLLTGPRGTGKTSSARIFAKSLNCLAGDRPTPTPCGKCDVCRAIARGSALDVIEIDAASNTGVDNIREIIERSQFAPVQCRYKVYAIDECLTGDSLVQTSEGLTRIDDANLKGKMVLSYNEISEKWEYKKVLRWLERGVKETLAIKTTNRKIRCTGNHLIRTDTGWIRAQDVKEGMKILSPVNVDAAVLFTNMVQIGVSVDSPEDTNLEAINTDKKTIILPLSWNKLKLFDPCVLVDVAKNSIFQLFYSKKAKELSAFTPTGQSIHTKRDTVSGSVEPKICSSMPPPYNQKSWDLSMEHYWEMAVSTTQIPIADFLDYAGHTEKYKNNGWNIKPAALQNYDLNYDLHSTEDTEKIPSVAKQFAILSLRRFWRLSSQAEKNMFLWIGCNKSLPKDELGGTWMMAHSVTLQQEVRLSCFIQKAIPTKKINLLPIGLQTWDIPLQQNLLPEAQQAKHTTTSKWEQTPVKNGYQTCDSIPSPQWITSLETVESVEIAGVEKVYDLEIEDNHNFVANNLLVHNCHMLSTAAFNALLKTLEEPPERVIFILATTDPQRVLPTIISRCQRFDFRRIPLESMVTHLKYIASQENIDIDAQAITIVSQIANGGLRDAQSLLDQLSLLSGQITADRVWDLVGSVAERDLLLLLKAIASDSSEAVLEQCRHLMNRGREPLIILQNLAGFYLNLLIAKTASHRPDMVAVTSSTWQELCQEAQHWDLSTILQGQQYLKESETQLKNTTQPRLWLEVTLLGLLPSACRPALSVTPVQQPPVSSSEVALSRRVTQPPSPSPVTEPVELEISKALPPTDKRSAEDETVPAIVPSPTSPTSQTPIWQSFIEHLQPFTQALVRSHCHLISVDENVARIGVSTEPLLGMAKKRANEMETAFQAVCRRPVKIQLQVASAIDPKSHSEATVEQDVSFSSPVHEVSKTPEPQSISKPIEPPPQPSLPTTSNGHRETQPPADAEEPELNETAIAAHSSPDEIQKAAESLAKCFDGEIVVLDRLIEDKLSIANEQEAEPVVAEPSPEESPESKASQPTIRGRIDLSNITDEDEIPFRRPVYFHLDWGKQLCDSWELAANAYRLGSSQLKG
jgi:DNA polymerase-3 subunit gamma/tau